jgi:hypothetical protein
MTHLDDGTLVTILDGEQVDPSATDHLRTCVACRTKLDALRARSEAVSQRLASSPAPAHPGYDPDFVAAVGRAVRARGPARFPRRWALLAAALAGVIFAASPAAAWLAAEFGALIRGAPEMTRGPTPATGGQETGATLVSTEIEGEGLVVRIVAGAAPTRLVVRGGGGMLATARITPGGAGQGVTVHPDGFEVRAGPAQEVEVDVPAGVAWVEVRLGDRALARRPLSELAVGPWIIEPGG